MNVSLVRVLTMAGLAGGLYLWPDAAWRLDCGLSAVFILPYWIALIAAGSEQASLRRRAFVAQYLARDGRLARLLQPGVLLILWQAIKGLVLVLLLMMGSMVLTPDQRWLLLLNLPLLALLLPSLTGWSRGEINPDRHGPLVRYWAQWINTLLLWVGLLLLTWFARHPDFSGLAWQDALRFGAGQATSACDALALLVRLETMGSALTWWAAQNIFAGLERPDQLFVAWLLFVLSFGGSLLFAWIYSRVLIAAWSRPWDSLPGRMNRQ